MQVPTFTPTMRIIFYEQQVLPFIQERFKKTMHTDSKTKLMLAALELFREHGYKHTSTKRIAEKAGMNEASIFRIFGTKANLFYSTVQAMTISVKDLHIDTKDFYQDFTRDLTILIKTYLALYIRQMPIYRILFMVPLLYDADINHQVYAKVETLIRHFEYFLLQSHTLGLIRQSDYGMLSEMLFSSLLINAIQISATGENMNDYVNKTVQLLQRSLSKENA